VAFIVVSFACARVAGAAGHAAIARLVLRQGAGWMAAELMSGMLGVGYVARLLRGMLYGVSPFDPLVLGAAIATLAACATVALLLPLRRGCGSSLRTCGGRR